jgi:hypothetical protein
VTDFGDDEARGLSLMEESSAVIAAGVEELAAGWVVAAVTRVVDAWGRLDPVARQEVLAGATAAGAAARDRVTGELRDLFAADPARQRTTPLEVVRSLRREATDVLAAAGIPGVERDPFETRAFPDDEYALVPHSLTDLGDPALGPELMAWGLGKSKVLRARAARSTRGEP